MPDRYLPDPQDPNARFAEELRELRRRISELEAARPLGNTTLSNGVLRIVDGNGDLRAQLGRLTAAGGSGEVWGIEVVAQPGSDDWPDGKPYFRATEDGAEFPYGWIGMVDDAYVDVTSSSFVRVCAGGIGIVTHKFVGTYVLVNVPAGVTGEMRIANITGGTEGDAVELAAGTTAYVQIPPFEHGSTLWTGPILFEIQARRTSGASPVQIAVPPVFGLHFVPR